MVVLILVIALCGVLAVGSLKGWFSDSSEAAVQCTKASGVVNIERSGIGYTLKEETVLQSGDVLETKKGSSAELALLPSGRISMDEDTELELLSCDGEGLKVQVRRGQIFADASAVEGNLEVEFSGNTAVLTGAVFGTEVYTGSAALNVLKGAADVTVQSGTKENADSGERLNVIEKKEGEADSSIQKLQPSSMNEFLILQAQKCGDAAGLCFASDELQQVLDDREAEKQAAIQEGMSAAARIPKELPLEEENGSDAAEAPADTADNPAAEDTQADEMQAVQNDVQTAQNDTQTTQNGTQNAQNGTSDVQDQADDAEILECTITIRCDTILDHMEDLTAGKEAYVPANGCILATSTVEFTEGETVFDILSRVCEYAGIQLEYAWTPLYNSYYIEGINQLYEFDCGNESGWMFKVNGWFPNYGCSAYTLKDGDSIVWTYTCRGLGADVGNSVG